MSGKRKDSNHNEVVETFASFGFEFLDLSQFAAAGCDGIVLGRGKLAVVEIKDGSLPESRRRLTKNEQRRKVQCERQGIPYNVIENNEQAMNLARSMR